MRYFFVAVSDAIRTSLGPRGMDKMVYFIFIANHTSLFNKIITKSLT